jgi:hypothetical protein
LRVLAIATHLPEVVSSLKIDHDALLSDDWRNSVASCFGDAGGNGSTAPYLSLLRSGGSRSRRLRSAPPIQSASDFQRRPLAESWSCHQTLLRPALYRNLKRR